MAVIANITVNHNGVCDCDRVDVTDSDWHYLGMPEDHDVDWDAVGQAVARERMSRGWSKEEAGRRAGVSSITWKRVEDGKRVQDGKLGLILKSLSLTWGESGLVTQTSQPHEVQSERPAKRDTGAAAVRLREVAEQNIADLQAEAERAAADLAGTDPERAARILRDAAAVAVELRTSVERTIAGVVQLPMSVPSDEVPDAIAAHEEEEPIAGETGHDEHP